MLIKIFRLGIIKVTVHWRPFNIVNKLNSLTKSLKIKYYQALCCPSTLLRFKDTISKKIYKCRVAFQVLIEPGSYLVAKETIGYGNKQIDSEFDNSEIEWSTKQYGTTILYGLLIKAELAGPLGDCLYRKICQRFLKTLSLPGIVK